MTEDKAAILRGINDNPEDDARRLVYCDWLEEHDGDEDCQECSGTGRERYCDAAGDIDERSCLSCNGTGERPNGYAVMAEFIRVQIELANLQSQNDEMAMADISHFDRDRSQLIKRIKEKKDRESVLWLISGLGVSQQIAKTVQPRWTVRLLRRSVEWDAERSSVGVAIAHRGFIAEIRCEMAQWERFGRSMCELHPITRVVITDKEPSVIQPDRGPYRWVFTRDRETLSLPNRLPMFLREQTLPNLPVWYELFTAHKTAHEAKDSLSIWCIKWAKSPKSTATDDASGLFETLE